jgi:MFS family permease
LIPNVGSWQHVLWVVPLSGGSISFFWPSLQAWLAELTAGGRRALNRAMGWFNVLWCIGLMLGPVATGYLWGMDYRLCFYLPAAMLTPLILLLLLTPRGVTRPAQSPGSAEVAVEARAPPAPENLAYLRMAWLGNFASWFIWGTILGVFPKLGHVLGFETPAIGWLLFVYRLGQVMMFLCTSYEERWHYRLRPLLAAQFAAVAGVGLAAVASSKLAFAAGFAAAGLCAGVTYAASLFYSLDGRTEGRGRTSGIHEAVLGSGVFLGPLVGGVVAQCVSLRAPFAVAALLMLAASLMQLSVWRRHRRLVAAGGPGGGTEQACA